MKNTDKLFNLLTAFTATIGLCAASLVCFIIIYTNINGSFPKNPASVSFKEIPTIYTESSENNIMNGHESNHQIGETENIEITDTETQVNNPEHSNSIEISQNAHESLQPENTIISDFYGNEDNPVLYTMPVDQSSSANNYIADTQITDNQNLTESNTAPYESYIQQQGASNNTMVWIDDTAKRYHKKNGCGMDNAYQVTLEEALQKGKTPCGNCYR